MARPPHRSISRQRIPRRCWPIWISLKSMRAPDSERPYHHGHLAPCLRESARAILEEEGMEALSLRSVARRAGVSHAAPYRHYVSREALLADVACEGVANLRA